MTTGKRDAIVVPREAIYRRAGVDYVRLKDGAEIVVQTGEQRGEGMEILAGLHDGDSRRAMKLGISGALTRTFIGSPLTPLLLLASLLVGLIALQALPREEEPQISVPMVDIIVSTNGYKAQDAIELVTRPLEDIIKGTKPSRTRLFADTGRQCYGDGGLFVGTPQDNAVLRVHDKIRGNITGLPKGIPSR